MGKRKEPLPGVDGALALLPPTLRSLSLGDGSATPRAAKPVASFPFLDYYWWRSCFPAKCADPPATSVNP